MISSLYVHIPFCTKICSYCDFCKLIYNDKFAFSYIKELKKELLSYPKQTYKTIYVGGGTPSSLPTNLLEDIISFLEEFLEPNGEFTVEVNPENLTLDKAKILFSHKVNRISIGMQTSSNDLLKLINRPSFETFLNSYKILTDTGFTNINIDLMYALPDENNDQVISDLKEILKLKPKHISTYSLILEENSVFAKKGYKEASEDVQASQYELILKTLRENGYERYEVSNFSLPGYESRHNLTYWKDKEYVGIGLGASGFIDDTRYTNTKSLTKYLKSEYLDFKEKVEGEDKIKYFLLTNLRLAEGFSLKEFESNFGFSFQEKYEKELSLLINQLLLVESGGRIKASDKGILLLDRILVSLF